MGILVEYELYCGMLVLWPVGSGTFPEYTRQTIVLKVAPLFLACDP